MTLSTFWLQRKQAYSRLLQGGEENDVSHKNVGAGIHSEGVSRVKLTLTIASASICILLGIFTGILLGTQKCSSPPIQTTLLPFSEFHSRIVLLPFLGQYIFSLGNSRNLNGCDL